MKIENYPMKTFPNCLRSLLFDFDDTLVPELIPEEQTLKELHKNICNKHINSTNFSNKVLFVANKFWNESKYFPYTNNIGFTPFEGLWSPFYDVETTGTKGLNSWLTYYRKSVWSETLNIFHIPGDWKELSELFCSIRKNKIKPYRGVNKLLAYCKTKYSIGLITNGSSALQNYKISASGLKKYFNTIVIGDEVGNGKPSRVPFQKALEDLNSSPEQAIMIGNSLTHDIVGANNIGIYSVLVKTSETNIVDTYPDNIIESVTDVLTVLKQKTRGKNETSRFKIDT